MHRLFGDMNRIWIGYAQGYAQTEVGIKYVRVKNLTLLTMCRKCGIILEKCRYVPGVDQFFVKNWPKNYRKCLTWPKFVWLFENVPCSEKCPQKPKINRAKMTYPRNPQYLRLLTLFIYGELIILCPLIKSQRSLLTLLLFGVVRFIPDHKI